MSAASALIKTARTEAGITQRELGERMGVSQAAIARLEGPHSNPRLSTLEGLLHATGHRLELSAVPYRSSVDESLIALQLRMTPAERVANFEAAYEDARELVLAAARSRGESS